jgi:hypothetical protein
MWKENYPLTVFNILQVYKYTRVLIILSTTIQISSDKYIRFNTKTPRFKNLFNAKVTFLSRPVKTHRLTKIFS